MIVLAVRTKAVAALGRMSEGHGHHSLLLWH